MLGPRGAEATTLIEFDWVCFSNPSADRRSSHSRAVPQVDKHLAKSFNHKAVAALDELLSEACRVFVPLEYPSSTQSTLE